MFIQEKGERKAPVARSKARLRVQTLWLKEPEMQGRGSWPH